MYSPDERITTKTYPTGITEITQRDAFGRILSISGTAVPQRYYEYGVNSDGTQWTKEYKGGSTNALTWTKSTIDLLGRTICEEKPGSNGAMVSTQYDYNLKGLIAEVHSTHQPTILYEYNLMGKRVSKREQVQNAWRLTEEEQTYQQAMEKFKKIENEHSKV